MFQANSSQLFFECSFDCSLPDRLSCPRCPLGRPVFITSRHQEAPVVARDLEYESLLGARDHFESNDFIIDLYHVDRDPVRCLLVGCLQVFLPFVIPLRMGLPRRVCNVSSNSNLCVKASQNVAEGPTLPGKIIGITGTIELYEGKLSSNCCVTCIASPGHQRRWAGMRIWPFSSCELPALLPSRFGACPIFMRCSKQRGIWWGLWR